MLKKRLLSYDYSLIIAVILLSVLGLIMVYSASMEMAVQRYGVSSNYFYLKQRSYLVIAFIIFAITAFIPYRLFKKTRILATLVFGSIIVLFALSLFGHVAGGAQSWIRIGPLNLEPSEFVKLCVIIYLSAVYAKKQAYINEFNRGIAPPLIYLGIVVILIASQPDFGTVELILAFSTAIILSSGISLKNLTKLFTVSLLAIIPIVLIFHNKVFSSYRMQRFAVLKNPFDVSQSSGYQLVNSFLAIGSGGINGLGLGRSVEKLGYLPEPHTDFIMAVIAEELGIWGVGFVILSLAFIVLKGFRIAVRCKDPFGSLLAVGISSMIGIQAFVNLAGVSGIMPLAGVPLPFVSYGGSSLIQLAIAIGILTNVSMQINYENKYKNEAGSKKTVKNRSFYNI